MTYKNPHYLIESSELLEKLNTPNLRVFDTAVFLHAGENGYQAQSGRELYQEGHIPTSGFIDLIDEWADTTNPLNFTIPSFEALSSAIGESGISENNEVVLYSSGHIMWATRAWWCLHFAGHKNIRVLNGNFSGWKQENHPIETGSNHYSAQEFISTPNPEVFSDTNMVEAATQNGVCVINALSQSLYEGTGDFYYKRRGHIPNSHLLFYGDLLNNEFFLPASELKKVIEQKNLKDTNQIITYCGGGIAATVDAFAYKLLGHDNISVYDGSMSEWVQSDDRPLKEGTEP